ncbi:RagB/SusD family nutrient uptake outer membrane protein [Joostella atrarenae]|uniref:RagB/SusD family nutrient uptake outer membrane protein n=1 Tax=Joostella atrarenae TaxID=679257 RepID=A0ABS9J5E3_9FLAO|nr:RagB/SusD family nutrient uptake outer membrane protein [Joostella atrarenae]MCF8715624.1 RagB/SusD family nutrient uptake outer membrane protein [Joostella atrarenae]
MKNYIKILFALIILTGCSEDLERLPLNSVSVPQFWQTSDDAILGINGVYNILSDNAMYRNFMRHSDAISDNAYSQYSFNNYLEISEGIGYDTSSPLPNQFWDKSYEGIVRANEVIQNVPNIDMDEELKKRVIGEAKFLRALFYFHLTNLFHDVPLVLVEQTIEESLVPRNPKSEVLAQIYLDIDAAISILPEVYGSSDMGRATKGAAYALLSRVALYNEDYEKSITASEEVISLGYDLVASDKFSDLFLPILENNSVESIFEVQFLGNSGTDGVGSNFNSVSGALPNFSDTYNPLKNFVDFYSSDDIRLAATILQPGDVFAGVEYDPVSSPTGYAVRKSIIEDEDVTNEGDANFVVFRFAEILLNYAEAQNELYGPNTENYDAINRIRNRAGLDDLEEGLSKDALRDAIKRERRLELAFEGHHYFDLLRYGGNDLEESMEHVTSVPGHVRVYNDRLLLWPVPQSEIIINENLLPQNPGW